MSGILEARVPLDDREGWRDALRGIPHDFGHTWEYCHALSLTFGDPVYLYLFDDGATRVVCPYQVRTFRGQPDIVTLPGFSGFVGSGPCPDFPTYWRAFAAAQGYVCGYLSLSPVLHETSYAAQGDVTEHNAVYVVDLGPDLDTLFAALDRNRRRQLRDWSAISTTLLHDRQTLTEFLVGVYPAFLRSIGATAAYARSEATLEYLCSLEQVFLVGTQGPQGPTSVYVFGYTETIGTCLFHAALPEARQNAASLVWAGIRHLKERGVLLLNLGGGITDDDNVAAAKKRFGSRRHPLAAVRQIYRPAAYEMLCQEATIGPYDALGFFPPYRATKHPTSERP